MGTKPKGDIEIGHRMIEELVRIFGTQAQAIRRFPCNRHCIDNLRAGGTPGGYILAKLHYCGGDVIYVLTGKREKSERKASGSDEMQDKDHQEHH